MAHVIRLYDDDLVRRLLHAGVEERRPVSAIVETAVRGYLVRHAASTAGPDVQQLKALVETTTGVPIVTAKELRRPAHDPHCPCAICQAKRA
jgi:hypothetical protein